MLSCLEEMKSVCTPTVRLSLRIRLDYICGIGFDLIRLDFTKYYYIFGVILDLIGLDMIFIFAYISCNLLLLERMSYPTYMGFFVDENLNNTIHFLHQT